MTYHRYNGDPRWITAKFRSQCSGCSKPVNKGDAAFFYPRSKSVYGAKCGCAGTEAGKFESALFDEANNACL